MLCIIDAYWETYFDGIIIFQVVLGAEGNTKSFIRDSGEKTIVNTEVIVNPFEYRGFWIQLTHEHVAVGREDEVKGTKCQRYFSYITNTMVKHFSKGGTFLRISVHFYFIRLS